MALRTVSRNRAPAQSLLPKGFPPVSTVRSYFYRWRDDGLLAEINRHLVAAARLAAGRNVQPTAGVTPSRRMLRIQLPGNGQSERENL